MLFAVMLFDSVCYRRLQTLRSAVRGVPRAAVRPTVAAALVLLGLLAAIPARADDGCTWSPRFSGTGGGGGFDDSGYYGNSTINVSDDFVVGSIRAEMVYRFAGADSIALLLAPPGVRLRNRDPSDTSIPEGTVVLTPGVRITTLNEDQTLSFSSTNHAALQTLINRTDEPVGAAGAWRLQWAETGGATGNRVVSWALELGTGGLPQAPANLLPAVGAYQVELTWDDPEDDSITGWQYRQNTDATALGDDAWIDIDGSSAATTSHLVTGLALASTYHFQVRGCPGGAASKTVSATTPSKAVRIDTPAAPEPVSGQAGAEVAALAVQLSGDGGEVDVSWLSVKVQAGGAGKVADIARVEVYRDLNGDGALDAGDPPVGGRALNAAGEASIGTGGLTIAPGEQVPLLFALQVEPTVSAAGGGLLVGLLGGLLAFAAARRRQRGGRTRRAGRVLTAVLVALALAGCQAALTEPQEPQEPQEPETEGRTYQLTLTAVQVASDAGADLPKGGITGPTVTIRT